MKFPIFASKGNVQEIVQYRADFSGFSGKCTGNSALYRKFPTVGNFTYTFVYTAI